MNFDELKQQVISSEWIKIGSKLNNAQLSIFPDSIKEHLKSLSYQPGKNYIFDDNTHSFKIVVTTKDNNLLFEFFAKSKATAPIVKPKASPYKIPGIEISNKFDAKTIIYIIVILIILVGSVVLWGPISTVFGW